MSIQLSDSHQARRVEELARQRGKAPEDVLQELVEKALLLTESESTRSEGMPPANDNPAIRRQRDAWEQAFEAASRIPVAVKDGFSGRDHDRVLYGGKG